MPINAAIAPMTKAIGPKPAAHSAAKPAANVEIAPNAIAAPLEMNVNAAPMTAKPAQATMIALIAAAIIPAHCTSV